LIALTGIRSRRDGLSPSTNWQRVIIQGLLRRKNCSPFVAGIVRRSRPLPTVGVFVSVTQFAGSAWVDSNANGGLAAGQERTTLSVWRSTPSEIPGGLTPDSNAPMSHGKERVA